MGDDGWEMTDGVKRGPGRRKTGWRAGVPRRGSSRLSDPRGDRTTVAHNAGTWRYTVEAGTEKRSFRSSVKSGLSW